MPIDHELVEGLIDEIRQRLAELRPQKVTEERLEERFFLWGVEHGLQTMSVRNRLVHEYGVVSKKKLVEFVNKDLGDIDEYVGQIVKYLSKEVGRT